MAYRLDNLLNARGLQYLQISPSGHIRLPLELYIHWGTYEIESEAQNFVNELLQICYRQCFWCIKWSFMTASETRLETSDTFCL